MVRQVKYLNNIIDKVDKDHQVPKRVTRPMFNFKSFRCAGCVLAGVELMHMIRMGQFEIHDVLGDVVRRPILCAGQ